MLWLSMLIPPFQNCLTHSFNSLIFVRDPTDQNLPNWEESFGHSNWFKETLPTKIRRTRCFHYRYHNQSSQDSPVAIVNRAAHGLLSEWAKLGIHSPPRPLIGPFENDVDRSNGPSRPVLFVCQSFGGPVVEEV